MTQTHRQLAAATAASVALVLSAPYVGVVRSQIRSAFPGQFGLITALYYRAWRARLDLSALVLPLLAAFVVGIADEAVQWFIPARVGELKDVWLNGVAISCGLLFGAGFEPPSPFRFGWRPGSLRMVANGLALTVVALAAFVQLVHVGVKIRDSAIGAFGSRFAAARLAALGAERAEAWKHVPPTTRPPRLSREDQYMTEGLQHVQARNSARGAGDAFSAWRENLILEQWFAPVLDTPSYVSATGHRWSADHRADAEGRVKGTEDRDFVSRAYPYPLYYWPGFRLWAGALALAGLLVIAGLGLRRR